MVAKKILDRRECEIAIGKIPGIQFEKVRFDELAEEYLIDYRINNRKISRPGGTERQAPETEI